MTLSVTMHRIDIQLWGAWIMKERLRVIRSFLRNSTLLRLSTVAILALSLSGFVAQNADAASTPSGSLVFTGALNGTLVLGPHSVCKATKHGVTLSSFTTTLSSQNNPTWSVSVYVIKLGTYQKFRAPADSFVLNTRDGDLWVATQGSMTVIAKSGTVNLTLDDHEGLTAGTVRVTGTWICPT